jgi:hypothetical protein
MAEKINPALPSTHPLHDPSYPDHFSFPGLPKHFSLVSAQNSPEHNANAHSSLAQDLKQAGFEATPVKGHYSHPEESYLVAHEGIPEHRKAIENIGWQYGQEAVLHHSENKSELVFQDGRPSWTGEGFSHGPHLKEFYTQLPSGHRFRLNVEEPEVKKADEKPFDLLFHEKKKETKEIHNPHHYGSVLGINIFHAMHESHDHLPGVHVKDPDDEKLEDTISLAQENGEPAVVIHGHPPSMLRENAPGAAHPHAYDWHDGHTEFYSDDAENIEKAESFTQSTRGSPRPEPIKEPHSDNAQAAGKGVASYRPIAERYGHILPNHKSNLNFYGGIERHEPAIDHMIAEHGYKTYFAGGKYGRPDLKAKNYNTKHLMIWDPSPGSGGDFQNEAFTRSWRKVHELSHALTYPEVNNLYGEGRRLGKMGVRSPREAKRAVHWEWLAAHKQREISEKLGHKISDEDFHRELNTVMHDAVHRALTGQFTEPSDEGFVPSSEKISLEHALGMIDEHAKKSGLEHEEATFRTTGVPKDVKEQFSGISKSERLSGELKEGGKIKKFYLWREQDESGVSGTGRVAEGVIFSNGWVGMNWLTRWGSLAFYPSIHDCLLVHGHAGKTTVVYEDQQEDSVKKAFTQGDGETLTDPKSHDQAMASVAPELLDWGKEHLVPLKKDDTATLELAGKTIKVRKVLADLYSGWIEHENHIIHQFEKLTLPLVLSQLQSKLELYGSEEKLVAGKKQETIEVPVKELVQEHEKLVDALENPTPQKLDQEAKVQSKELEEYKNKLIDSSAGIADRIKKLQTQLKEHVETIHGMELSAGIENPETECQACERSSEACICYMNLPKPRIEITAKGVNIFFKSEWQEEDILNFKNDLTKRAGIILYKRRLTEVKETLAKIRDRIKGNGKD